LLLHYVKPVIVVSALLLGALDVGEHITSLSFKKSATKGNRCIATGMLLDGMKARCVKLSDE
jgi:hypothetical protein